MKIIKMKLMLICMALLCSCSGLPLSQIDRSRVNSQIMDFEKYSNLNSTSPHTAMRSKGSSSAGGCSVCAH